MESKFLTKVRRFFHNLSVKEDDLGNYDLWLDDVRPAPTGWYWALTAEEAFDFLFANLVRRWSLDHDLSGQHTGYDLLCWLEEVAHLGYNFWPANRAALHTSNPVGRQNMTRVLDRVIGYERNGYGQ